MTTDSPYAGEDPRGLLAGARALTRRVRADQRATWFPLLVFAAVMFAAIPVFLLLTSHHLHCVPTGAGAPAGARVCLAYQTSAVVYWPVATVVTYVAIAAFYLRRSARRGVGTPIRPYAMTGIVLAAVMTGAALWAIRTPPNPNGDSSLSLLGVRLGFPLPFVFSYPTAIGAALLVLAWVERNRALLGVVVAYVVVEVIGFSVVNSTHIRSPLRVLPEILTGAVLLLGGIGFLLAQRPWRHAS